MQLLQFWRISLKYFWQKLHFSIGLKMPIFAMSSANIYFCYSYSSFIFLNFVLFFSDGMAIKEYIQCVSCVLNSTYSFGGSFSKPLSSLRIHINLSSGVAVTKFQLQIIINCLFYIGRVIFMDNRSQEFMLSLISPNTRRPSITVNRYLRPYVIIPLYIFIYLFIMPIASFRRNT